MSNKIDILAFGAHPDDIELGCGGTLHKLSTNGNSTGMIDLTEGEMGTRGTVGERYKESAIAAEILGAKFRDNLQIPDANIRLTKENRDKVINVIRKYKPALVFAPYPNDRHPDHVHSSNLVTEACFYAGVGKISSPDHTSHHPKRIIYYMMTYEFDPSFVVDISGQFLTKMKAVKAHRSQFYNPDFQGEETFISSKDYIEAVELRARNFGWQAGVRYAEPFWVREMIVLEDVFGSLIKNMR